MLDILLALAGQTAGPNWQAFFREPIFPVFFKFCIMMIEYRLIETLNNILKLRRLGK